MTPLRALRKAIAIAGSQSKLGKAIGYSQAAVSLWLLQSKRAPAEVVIAIEKAVDGKVTRQELRPDLYA